MTPRFTSPTQKLDNVDCRERMVLTAKSAPAISSIEVWIITELRSWTRASRPAEFRRNISLSQADWTKVTEAGTNRGLLVGYGLLRLGQAGSSAAAASGGDVDLVSGSVSQRPP
jgi:hypothetical protein